LDRLGQTWTDLDRLGQTTLYDSTQLNKHFRQFYNTIHNFTKLTTYAHIHHVYFTTLDTTLQNFAQLDTTLLYKVFRILYKELLQSFHKSINLYSTLQYFTTIQNSTKILQNCTHIYKDFTTLSKTYKTSQHFTTLYKPLHKSKQLATTLQNSTKLQNTLDIFTKFTKLLHNFPTLYQTFQHFLTCTQLDTTFHKHTKLHNFTTTCNTIADCTVHNFTNQPYTTPQALHNLRQL